MTRRSLLRYGLTGAAVASGKFSSGQRRTAARRTPPFQASLPRLPVLNPTMQDATTDYYQMTLAPSEVEIIPGLRTTAWAFNGSYPGPTILAQAGRTVRITQTNRLNVQTSVHLHGGHTPADSDGHPVDLFNPGTSKQYNYPNNQGAGTLWYHDHAVGETARNVYMGLAGFYLIRDPAESLLNLPSGDFDMPIMIQDKTFQPDGSLYYPPIDSGIVHFGFLGDTMVVNGAIQPYMPVVARKYRLRLLNASNARDYSLQLQDSRSGAVVPMTQIGSDGGLLPAPVVRTSLAISPGERADVVVDFSAVPVGSSLVMLDTNAASSTTLGQVMRFDIVDTESDDSSIPQVLTTVERLHSAQAAQNRQITLGLDGRSLSWVLNGQAFDPARIDFTPALNSVEVWTWVNHSGMIHPMHLHNVQVQVLSRNGQAPPAWESGWRDTVPVHPGERVSVIMRFADNTGTYVFHCHKLEHEDHDMMGQFEVVG
jgi:FtsP/CotA-like multicopper oxidase with cupredoxin domain